VRSHLLKKRLRRRRRKRMRKTPSLSGS